MDAADFYDGPLFDTDKMGVKMSEEELAARLWKDLNQDLKVKNREAEALLLKTARERGSDVYRFQDGMGQNVAGIPKSVYAYWIAREGPHAWDDGSLLRYLARSYPALMRESRGKPMVVVGWGGNRSGRSQMAREARAK